MSKEARRALATQRKSALVASGRTYSDLARLANVSYSMAEKWMNARRTSSECQRAWDTLTGKKESAA